MEQYRREFYLPDSAESSPSFSEILREFEDVLPPRSAERFRQHAVLEEVLGTAPAPRPFERWPPPYFPEEFAPAPPPRRGGFWPVLVLFLMSTASLGTAWSAHVGLRPLSLPGATPEPTLGSSAPQVQGRTVVQPAPPPSRQVQVAAPTPLVRDIMNGATTIKVHGDESFKVKMNEALAKIASLPEGLALLEELTRNPEKKKVFISFGRESFTSDCTRRDLSRGCSDGDVSIEFNDEAEAGGAFELVLAHELDHARRFISGSDQGGRPAQKRGFPNREEELAVAFENVMRRGLGYPDRESYYHSEGSRTRVIRVPPEMVLH